MLLRIEMLHMGTLLCKSHKIVNICYDHRSPVWTLDNDTHWLNNVLNPQLWNIVPFLDKHLRQRGHICWRGTLFRRHAQWETYQQTWQANPLHLCHLPEENFVSNELYGPVHCLAELSLINALLLANLHAVSYGGHCKYWLFCDFLHSRLALYIILYLNQISFHGHENLIEYAKINKL